MRKVAITNIGKLVSGDLEKGVLDATSILTKDNKIIKIGSEKEIGAENADATIDANGLTVTPGLIDGHVHITLGGDYAPMHNAIGTMQDALLSGTTTLISEGEQSPGLPRFYPKDPLGVKTTAILGKKIFDKYRPGGALKVHAGALVLAEGLTEQDFKEMAGAGVWIVGEIGGGGAADLSIVIPMVEWARKYEMFVSIHFGARLIPGATTMTTEEVLKINPDKVAHANGGTTAASMEETKKLIESTKIALEIVSYGNPKMTYEIVEMLKKKNELNRLVFGSDTPTGQGQMPFAINRAIVKVSSLNGIPAEKAIAMATGNTADLYGLNTGKIEEGREADIIVIDRPPGSVGKDALEAIEAGDLFGTALIMVDGKVIGLRGRDARPTAGNVKINGIDAVVTDINEHIFEPRLFHPFR